MGVKEIKQQLDEWAHDIAFNNYFTQAQIDCADEIEYIEWEE